MNHPDSNRLRSIAEKIGIDAASMTLIRMSKGSDERHRDLELIQGGWDEGKPWVVIDEDDHVYTVTSADSLVEMVRMLISAQNENFRLKLEKAIWQRLPVDFEDVWAVAMERIRSQAQAHPERAIVNLDLDWLVNEIKEKYPNLFYHLDQMLDHPQPLS